MKKWTTQVVPVSVGLEATGYAHQVVNGIRTITVTHHREINFDHILTEDMGNGYVRTKGVGRRKHDLTPHWEAVVIANALNEVAPPDLKASSSEVSDDRSAIDANAVVR